MFEPSLAVVALAFVVLLPFTAFQVLRPRLRRTAADSLVSGAGASVARLAAVIFAVVQPLALLAAGVGVFSVAFPAALDLGLVRKVYLLITSEPRGVVTIDGRAVGMTPARGSVAVGRHRFKLDGIPEYAVLDTSISVVSAETVLLKPKILPPSASTTAPARNMPSKSAGRAPQGDAGRSVAESGVRSTIEGWRGAWQRGALDEYMSYYSTEFWSQYKAMNYSQWREDKRAKFAAYHRGMRVDINSLTIELLEGEARVRFLQSFTGYGRERYSDKGRKTLVMKREGADWKIVREEWSAE